MKVLFLILVIAAGLGYYFFYYREQPAPTPPPENAQVASPTPAIAAPTPNKRGFDELTTLLRQDMDAIPMALDGPAHPPANAFKIKRQIGTHAGDHPEYQTLVQACDLIILADGQRASLQQACHAEQSRSSFGGSLHSGGSMDRATSAQRTPTPDPKAGMDAIHSRIETSWQAQRQQTSTQVQQLLASLSGKQL